MDFCGRSVILSQQLSKNGKCTEVDGIHPATKVTGILPSFFVNISSGKGILISVEYPASLLRGAPAKL